MLIYNVYIRIETNIEYRRKPPTPPPPPDNTIYKTYLMSAKIVEMPAIHSVVIATMILMAKELNTQ